MEGKRVLAGVVLSLAVVSGACGVNDAANNRRGRGDAPVGSIDSTSKEVIAMPDRFSNVAHACDGHGHRVFVTTHTNSGRFMAVIIDPSCGKAGE